MAKNANDKPTAHEEVPGHRLVERTKQLIAEGNARAVRVTTDDRKISVEIPLTPAAITGGVVMLAAPWLAVLAAIAALVARAKVEILHDPTEASQPPPQPASAPDTRL